MTGLQVFVEYLKKTRAEKDAMARNLQLSNVTHEALLVARGVASEAELLGRLASDAEELEKDPAGFVKRTGL